MKKCTLKYIQTDLNDLLRFHTLELPRMVAHIILYYCDIFHNHESVNTLQIKY